MPEVADVFRCYGPAYQERFGADLLPSHRRAMDDIIHCRTEALGGHLLQCDHCGQEHYAYHSCRNRSCPKCHRHDTEVWLAERRQELLPVPYFHVVLTLPQELRELVRRHQQDLYDMLLRAAAQALIKLAADPHDVGGLIGVSAFSTPGPGPSSIIHMCTVWCQPVGSPPTGPSGGPPARPTWCPSMPSRSSFAGCFSMLVRQERPDLTLPESVWTKGWVVYGKPDRARPGASLEVPGPVCPPDRADQPPPPLHRGWAGVLPLPGLPRPALEDHDPARQEFIRRFLQHVLPQGFHKVRYYGLWSPVHRPLLHQLQLCLAGHAAARPSALSRTNGSVGQARTSYPEVVQGAWNALPSLLQDVGIDHGGGHVVVPEQWLNGADVGAALPQVGGEGVPKGMGADLLRQTGTANRHLDGLVDDAGVHVMATGDTGTRVDGNIPGGKDVLPAPFLAACGDFRASAWGR